jgi:hypothetical protein
MTAFDSSAAGMQAMIAQRLQQVADQQIAMIRQMADQQVAMVQQQLAAQLAILGSGAAGPAAAQYAAGNPAPAAGSPPPAPG